MRKAKVVWHKDDDAVSPVIGTILMVAITVVLAAVLWLMVSGMITDTDEQKTTVNIASPNMSSVTLTGPPNVGFNAVLNVNKITPKDDKVLWIDLKIIIKGCDGSVLEPESPVVADVGAGNYNIVYTTQGATPGLTGFYFVETSTGDNKLSAGDSIKITSLTDGSDGSWDFQGATVILKKSGEQIASITLPTDFS